MERDELVTVQAECEQLRCELMSARDAVRQAETDAGRLRGALAEVRVQLDRARQDQEAYQMRVARRLRLRRSIVARLRRIRSLGRL